MIEFQPLIQANDTLFTFLISLFAGEPGVLFLSSLSANDIVPIATVFYCAFGSALIGEIFWFALSRTRWAEQKERSFTRRHSSTPIVRAVEHHANTHPLMLLLLSRFIVGLSIFSIVYFGRRGMSYPRFISYFIIVNAIWTPIIVLIGYLAGSGFIFLLSILKGVEYVLSIAFFGIIIFVVLYARASKWVVKRLAEESLLNGKTFSAGKFLPSAARSYAELVFGVLFLYGALQHFFIIFGVAHENAPNIISFYFNSLTLLDIIAGVGLLLHQHWGRALAIIIALTQIPAHLWMIYLDQWLNFQSGVSFGERSVDILFAIIILIFYAGWRWRRA